jgi:hypothetical protein
MKKSIAFMAIAMFAGSGSLFASLQTWTHVTPQTQIQFTDTFTLPAFDTALGTLTGIQIKLTTNSFASVKVVNSGDSARNYSNAIATVPLQTMGPGGTTVTVNTSAGPFAGTAAANHVTTIAGLTNTNSNSVFVPFADFALYKNPPSGLLLSFHTLGLSGTYSGIDVESSGDLSFGGSAKLGGTTTLIYTYDAVTTPEPTMFGALAIGMAGLGFVARRRSLKA